MTKKKVLLTGASGSMGSIAFKELLNRKDRYDIVLLLLPGKKEKKMFKPYEGGKVVPSGEKGIVEHNGVKIVWGDITSYDDVLKAVTGVDFVLHTAALIAPAGDRKPKLAKAINYDGTLNIINAIKAQPNKDEIKLVYIGSIAEYGDRLPPTHRIRVGDPIMPSVYDYYGTTKVAAERAVIESGLKYWVSLRQCYIAIPNSMSLMDPIMFHQPIDQHIEFSNYLDAGYGLVNCLECPEDFWRRVYNSGGGPTCRFIMIEYIEHMMKLLGMGNYRDIMDRNWFALRNFHAAWYEDSCDLNEYIKYWRHDLNDHYQQVLDALPWHTKIGKYVPKTIVKHLVMKPMADPLKWMRNPEKNKRWISAFFNTQKAWKNIPPWDVNMPDLKAESHLLEHGFEKKADNRYTINDLQDAAKFRGGQCLSEKFIDMASKLKWKCTLGHEFDASPALVLMGGHWCPDCAAPPWNYDSIARVNPFIAQVYYKNHNNDEDNVYTEENFFEDLHF